MTFMGYNAYKINKEVNVMAIDNIQKADLTVKEIGEASLFAFFSNTKWFNILNVTVGHFILLPIIGLTFSLHAILEWIKLYRAKNKNADKWFSVIAVTLSAMVAIASMSGTISLEIISASAFAAGPWLFVSSLGILAFYQLSMLAINLFRAWQAPSNSAERKGYLQASFNNLFFSVLLGVATAAVVFAMLSPVGPVIMATVASVASVMILASITWRLMSHFKPEWVSAIKTFVGVNKPANEQLSNTLEHTNGLQAVNSDDESMDDNDALITSATSVHFAGTFFRPAYHRHRVQVLIDNGKGEQAKDYLIRSIKAKRASFDSATDAKSLVKSKHLGDLLNILQGQSTELVSNLDIPQDAHQSFWAKKGDTEQLYDAVKLWQSSDAKISYNKVV